MSGSWDDFFDWNHDGKLDAFEQAVKMDFLLDEWETDTSEDSDSLYGNGRSFGRSRVSGYAGGRSYTHGRSGRTTVGRKQTVSTASNTGTTALAGRQKSAVDRASARPESPARTVTDTYWFSGRSVFGEMI